jgi:hypothetical protein
VRQGTVSTIATPDATGANLKSRVKMGVTLKLDTGKNAKVDVRILGPGDVTGFDEREEIRTIPRHLTPDYKPNYFPAVEFDRPDFPWLFTPARANSLKQLRPWICLIAVPKKDGILAADPERRERPLPVLKVDNAQADLPKLSESWAWAHAQVSGSLAGGETLGMVLSDKPERTLSRLICPRHLKPNTPYYACIVPTFAVGCKAGLGQDISEDDYNKLDPAWDDGTTSIELPVYYHWEFSTGAEGDFESLVWMLERRELPSSVGVRDMQVKDLGSGLPDIGVLSLEGALKADGSNSTPVPATFQTKLRDLLNNISAGTPGGPAGDLVVPLPIYGCWHAGSRTITSDSSTPVWLRELNLDPRYRVAAGFGTLVVQENQEQLMAAAWEQVGEIERANQALRQAQLARAVGVVIHQEHIARMQPEILLAVATPVSSQVIFNQHTLRSEIHESVLPYAATSSQFRRITRSRGPLSRRMKTVSSTQWTGSLIKGLNQGDIRSVPPDAPPKGTVTIDAVFERVAAVSDHDVQIEKLCSITPSQIEAVLRTISTLSPHDREKILFGKMALEQQRNMEPCERKKPPEKPKLDLNKIQETLLSELDPNITVTSRLKKRLVVPGGDWNPEDPLESIMAAPEFTTPMYRPLAKLSQDLLLPGLENIPRNTVALLRTNPSFIEAYMVGLNHEMSRELLWRGFPTDQRGTYFRQFWDTRGHVPPPATAEEYEKLKDIVPIHQWNDAKHLGENMAGSSSTAQIALVIRGDLLIRYPKTIIYAARAKWMEKKDKDRNVMRDSDGNPIMVREPEQLPNNPDPRQPSFPEKYPIYQGGLSPDITFIGFDLDPDYANGKEDAAENKPGWFIVLQQPHTEPLFGLDELAATSDSSTWTWRDLSWEHVKTTNGGYIRLSDGLAAFNADAATSTGDPAGISWGLGSNSAWLAHITLQEPFRIAIHASDLLQEGSGGS